MTRILAGAAVTLALAAASGCMVGMVAHHADVPAPQADPGAMPACVMQACPMAVPGTTLSAADTADGEAVTFTTTPEGVADLRSRVHAMAEMHNRHHQGAGPDPSPGGMQQGGMMGGGHMGPSGGMHASMMPPPSRAAVEDVAGGARLVVTPDDPAQLERLRTSLRERTRHMQDTGACGMDQPAR